MRQVIEETGYVPNFAASSLSSGDYRNIGILGFLNDKESPLSNHLFMSILASFQKEITKHAVRADGDIWQRISTDAQRLARNSDRWRADRNYHSRR